MGGAKGAPGGGGGGACRRGVGCAGRRNLRMAAAPFVRRYAARTRLVFASVMRVISFTNAFTRGRHAGTCTRACHQDLEELGIREFPPTPWGGVFQREEKSASVWANTRHLASCFVWMAPDADGVVGKAGCGPMAMGVGFGGWMRPPWLLRRRVPLPLPRRGSGRGVPGPNKHLPTPFCE